MWGQNPSLFREKPGVEDSLSIVQCCAGDGIYGKSMSQSSLFISMWVFSHSFIGVTQLVSGSPHIQLYIWCIHGRWRTQESPLSPFWSILEIYFKEIIKWLLLYLWICRKNKIWSVLHIIHRIQIQMDKIGKHEKEKLKTFHRKYRRIYFSPRGMEGFLK